MRIFWRGPSGTETFLLQDLGDAPGSHRAPTLADGEAKALVHGDRLAELDGHGRVVAGHDHLGALGQSDRPRDVGGAEVELGPGVVGGWGGAGALPLGGRVWRGWG